jgi:hypothetical protein
MHHRRRRTYRRNPFGFSIPNLRRGAMNGAGVLLGRLGSRALPDMLGIGNMIAGSSLTSATATIALAGLQLAAGIVLGGFFRGELGGYIIAGTFDGVYEDVGTSFFPNTTFPGKYLGAYSRPLNAASAAAIRGYSSSTAALTPGNPRNPGSAPLAGRVGPAGLRRIGVGAAARVAR